MRKRRRRKFGRSGGFWVYIVECADKSYYTGYTHDLEKRIKEHSHSKHGAKYLRGRVPVKLVYAKEYKNYGNAVKAERDIRKRTRMEKEIMIKAYRGKFVPPDLLSKSKRGDDSQRRVS